MTLEAAVDDEQDITDIIQEVGDGQDRFTLIRWFRELRDWWAAAHHQAKRYRSRLARATCDARVPHVLGQRSEVEKPLLNLLLKELVEAKPRRWRSRHQQKIDEIEDPNERQRRNEQELRKVVDKLVQIVVEADLPVVTAAQKTADPEAALRRVFSTKRLRTLRLRHNAWSKTRLWLSCVFGVTFPTEVHHMIDYLEEIARGPMGRTIPGKVAGTLSFMEKAGAVVTGQRISEHPLWKSTVQSLTIAAQEVDNVTDRAPQTAVAIILSLELLMVDLETPKYVKFLAWVQLIMVWGCFRANDVENFCTVRLTLTRRCLRGVLKRSKVTGPGKKVGELPFWISRNVGLTKVDWLEVGFSIWSSEAIYKGGDYFIPLPNRDFSGSRKKYADSSAFSGLSKKLLADLRVPVRVNRKWTLGEKRLLPGDFTLFWRGHSARHFLVSVASADSVPKQDMDTVGRWGVNAAQSHDYIHTARQTCLKVQDLCCKAILEGPTNYDEDELQEQLKTFLRKRGRSSGLEQEMKNLAVLRGTDGLGLTYPARGTDLEVDPLLQPADDLQDRIEEDIPIDEKPGDKEEVKLLPGDLWMTVSRTGFRRLHQIPLDDSRGERRCNVRPSECREIEKCTKGAEKADRACKLCFPDFVQAVEESGASESSADDELDSSSDSDSDGGSPSGVTAGGVPADQPTEAVLAEATVGVQEGLPGLVPIEESECEDDGFD